MLDGDGELSDDESGETIDPGDVRRAMAEYRELIQFCADREANLVTVTLDQYQRLPIVIRLGWHIWIDERNKLNVKQRDRIHP